MSIVDWPMDRREDRPLVVIGGGGHAKVLISALRAMGHDVDAAFDDDTARHGQRLLGVPIAGSIERAARLFPDADGVIGIGSPSVRRVLSCRLPFHWIRVVHPHACVDPTVELGEGVVVMAGAVVQPETVLGQHAIVNTSASIDHDGRIGEFVNISPGVHLSGNVTVGDAALIGIGASVLQGISIGARTVVGGGAAVIRDLPADVVAVGCPARIIRPVELAAA
ncbi:MAG: acetyltransferase [Planctomycetaceae bacterium]|nr:acetyltransferase [Planctomycetaceae bacterium]